MMHTNGLTSIQPVLESCQRLQNTFEMVLRPFQQIAERLNIVLDDDGRMTMKLISVKGRKVRFANNTKEVRDADSYHLVQLQTLLKEADEDGFVSDERMKEIFKKFHAAKNPDAKTAKDPKKQIYNATSAMLRFAGIPKTYNGVDIIKRVRGKGIIIHNPDIEI